MSRKQQFFLFSTMMLLITVGCQLSSESVSTPTEKPTQPATNLPVFTLPTPTVGAGNDLPAIFPSFFLTDPNAVCLEHSDHAFSCLDAAGWHVYKNAYDKISNPVFTIPTWMTRCPDGRTYLTGFEAYKLEGKTLVDLGKSFDMSLGTIACGSGNEIWVMSSMDGVSRFDGSTWTHYPMEEIFSGAEADYPDIYSMAVAPDGNVWVTADHEIAAFDGTAWKSIPPPGNPAYWGPSARGEGLIIDSTGTVWAITYPENCCVDGQLSRYDGIQWTTFPGPDPETEFGHVPEIEYIAADRENRIWAATDEQKIYTLNTDTDSWDFLFDIKQLGLGSRSSYAISAMQFDGQDRLWLTTDYGVGIYDGSTWTIYHMHAANIYSNKISRLFILGDVPNLPALEAKPPGSISGKLVSPDSEPVVDAQVEVCLSPGVLEYRNRNETPCANQMVHLLANVNADGSFVVPNVLAGNYYLMIKLSSSWGTLVDSNSSQVQFRRDGVEFTVQPGEETQLGEISTSSETVSSGNEPVVTVEPSSTATETPITLPPTYEATVPVTVRIAGNENPASSRFEIWLKFSFKPGDILPGSQIESELNNGILELTLPGGQKKSFEQIPHSPTDSEITSNVFLPEGIGIRTFPSPAGTLPLNGFSFENFSNSPNGPQIRIPVEKISDISVIGEYQVAWKSGNLISDTLTFEWDGEKITVHEP